MRKYFTTGWLIILLAIFCGGCDGQKKGDQKAEAGPVAATVGDEPISTDDLRLYVENRRSRSGAGMDEKMLERYLQEIITTRSLSLEARRQKLDRLPAVRHQIDQLLAAKLLEKEVMEPVAGREISREEITAFYEKHRDEFSRPEQVRLGDIFIAAAKDGDPALRQEKKQEAEKVLQEAIDNAGTRNGFAALVRSRSDHHPLYSLGDTGFFDREGKPLGLDPAMVQAAFSFEQKGRVLDQLVETVRGFHIVMLVSRRSAMERKIDDLENEIRQRIKRDELNSKRKAFIARVTEDVSTKIHNSQIQLLVNTYQKEEKGRTESERKIVVQHGSRENTPPSLQKSGKE